MRRLHVVMFCLVVAAGCGKAQEVKTPALTGRVVDADGKPVAGAAVEAYDRDRRLGVNALELLGRAKTDAAGVFVLDVSSGVEEAQVLAWKEGFALGWDFWDASQSERAVRIRLATPSVLAGSVVDEAETPVAGAQLRASLTTNRLSAQHVLHGFRPVDWLACKTDSAGKFSLNNIPPDAEASFVVEAHGRATVYTPNSGYGDFAAGRTDIRIVMPVGGGLAGAVVEEGTRRPVAGVGLLFLGPDSWLHSSISGKDGAFQVSGLLPGSYQVRLVRPKPPVTAEWVSLPASVEAEAGRTVGGTIVEVTKGGIVEVIVTDADGGKPIEGVYVGLRPFSGRTGADGVARIRVLPDDYDQMSVYQPGYLPADPAPGGLAVGEGKTERVEVRLKASPRITGVVRDPAGNPLKGVRYLVVPFAWDPEPQFTGPDGRFEVIWDHVHVRLDAERSYLLLRDVERGLAKVAEVDEGMETPDITLAEGRTLGGKVVDADGAPVRGARVSVNLLIDDSSAYLQREVLVTDAEGCYQLTALPVGHDYEVSAEAHGYGGDEHRVSLKGTGGPPVGLSDIVLPRANLSISGVVTDEAGEAVAGAQVTAYGGHQPRRCAPADARGNFTMDGVCAGELRVDARLPNDARYGYAAARGGDRDVKIVLRGRQAAGEQTEKPPPSLVGKPLPGLDDFGFRLSAENKRVLLCFWDMDQRPSRHCVRELAARAEELAKKDVTVVLVHAAPADATALKEMTGTLKLSLPVGMPTGDAEKTLTAWGVRGLPWLILTDRGHVVRFEGFPPGALDEKLNQLAPGRN